jgi:hypothetical protein
MFEIGDVVTLKSESEFHMTVVGSLGVKVIVMYMSNDGILQSTEVHQKALDKVTA